MAILTIRFQDGLWFLEPVSSPADQQTAAILSDLHAVIWTDEPAEWKGIPLKASNGSDASPHKAEEEAMAVIQDVCSVRSLFVSARGRVNGQPVFQIDQADRTDVINLSTSIHDLSDFDVKWASCSPGIWEKVRFALLCQGTEVRLVFHPRRYASMVGQIVVSACRAQGWLASPWQPVEDLVGFSEWPTDELVREKILARFPKVSRLNCFGVEREFLFAGRGVKGLRVKLGKHMDELRWQNEKQLAAVYRRFRPQYDYVAISPAYAKAERARQARRLRRRQPCTG